MTATSPGPGLAGLTAQLTVRRVLRSFGYRGARPRTALVTALVVIALAESAVTAAVAVRFSGNSSLYTAIVPPTVMITLYVLAGPALLIGATSSTSTSGLERTLQTLPVAARAVRRLVWFPPLITAGLLMLLLMPPAVAILVASDVTVGQSLLWVVAATTASTAVAAGSFALVSSLLRGQRWHSLRYPFSILVLLAATVYAVLQLVRDDTTTTLLARLLGFPAVLDDVVGRVAHGGGDLLLTSVVATIVTFTALGVVVQGSSGGTATAPVRLRWSTTDRPFALLGDLLHVLRTPAVASNLVSVWLINTACVVVLFGLPDGALGQVINPAIAMVALFAGLPVRMVRGAFRVVWPAPQLAGVIQLRWVARVAGCSLITGLLGFVPALALLFSRRIATQIDPVALVQTLVVYLAVAALVGSVLAVPADESSGQVLCTWVYMLLASGVAYLAAMLADRSAYLGLAFGAGLWALGLVWAVLLERRRWQPSLSKGDGPVVGRPAPA